MNLGSTKLNIVFFFQIARFGIRRLDNLLANKVCLALSSYPGSSINGNSKRQILFIQFMATPD